MPIRFAERMERLGTEGAFEVLARARRLEAMGHDIVHLEIGEPDFATPDNITEAAVAALGAGYTHYTPAGGIMQVRESVAGFVSRRVPRGAGPPPGGPLPRPPNPLRLLLPSSGAPAAAGIFSP